jgi:molecular chaperone DnaK
MKLQRAVGIDLGTTNSAIAMMAPEGDDILLYADEFRRSTYPSIVGWHPDEERFVTGWEAWNRRALRPSPVSSVKRKMGKTELLEIGPSQLKPEEISSKILAGLAGPMGPFCDARIEDYDVELGGAVITVPAYFDAPQIEATKKAGELAGLTVHSLVQEPTAAAMYYAWKHGIGDGTFLVYDLGGGTFDVSVIRCLGGEYQVLGIDGDNFLGGDDFDRRLAEHFRRHLVEQGYALDLDLSDPDDSTRFTLLMRIAQEIKEALSTSDVQYVGRRNIFEDHNGESVTLELEFGRAQFEEMIGDLVDQSVERCQDAIARAGEVADITAAEIDHVLLVGGSTRVPLVRRTITEQLCDGQTAAEAPLQDEPDTCVALGAAIAAANHTGLRLVDDSGATLTITTPLYTPRASVRIVGRFEGTPEQLEAADSVALLNAAHDVAGVVRTEETEDARVFEFDAIDMPDVGRYPFVVEPVDRNGEPVASFPITAVRGEERELRPTGSALSNPTVLAKSLYLEVVRDGEAKREVLIERGASLPARGEFRFFTADRSGAVILRLYQNRFPIRTIHLTLPDDTSVGTPVDLDIEVDEAMAIVAQGEVAGQRFWAQIEPPPPQEERDWETIEALLEQVDEVGRTLWGLESRFFRRQADPLVAGIRETARTDPDKLQALAGRLEDLLAEYHNRDAELTPGWGRFESIVDAIKRVVYRGDSTRQLGMSTEQWSGKIATMEAEANQAYQNRDQEAWTQAFNQAQAIWESLAQDEYRFRNTDVSGQLKRLQASLRSEIDDLRTALSSFNTSSNPETEALQHSEIDRLTSELEQRVEQPLERLDLERLTAAQAKTELDRLWEAASHVRRQYEKLPTLGLVSR